MAQRALRYRAWRIEKVREGYRGSGLVRGRRLVIGVDGGRVRLREHNKRGRRRKSGRRGFDNPWREPKVLVVYAIDPRGRKQPCGLVRYDATLQDADGIFVLLSSLLKEIGAHEASHWIIIGDGADWIWCRVPGLAHRRGGLRPLAGDTDRGLLPHSGARERHCRACARQEAPPPVVP